MASLDLSGLLANIGKSMTMIGAASCVGLVGWKEMNHDIGCSPAHPRSEQIWKERAMAQSLEDSPPYLNPLCRGINRPILLSVGVDFVPNVRKAETDIVVKMTGGGFKVLVI